MKKTLSITLALFSLLSVAAPVKSMLGGLGASIGDYESLPYDAEVEYIESTGTQWIDTNLKPTRYTKSILDYQLVTQNGGRGVFGVYYYGSHYYLYQNSDTAMEVGFGRSKSNVYLSDTQRHTITYDNLAILVDGYEVYVGTYFNNIQLSLPLFTIRSDTKIYKSSFVKIYRFICFERDVLVLDMIPVRIGGTGYMYDKVSGELFGNMGTGSFIIGPDRN